MDLGLIGGGGADVNSTFTDISAAAVEVKLTAAEEAAAGSLALLVVRPTST